MQFKDSNIPRNVKTTEYSNKKRKTCLILRFLRFVVSYYKDVHDEQKRAAFYGGSGASVHGAIQRSDKSEIISIWTYKLLTIKLLYGIIH